MLKSIETPFLKELQNLVLCVNLVCLLFCSLRVYLNLYFLRLLLEKLFCFFAFICFLCFQFHLVFWVPCHRYRHCNVCIIIVRCHVFWNFFLNLLFVKIFNITFEEGFQLFQRKFRFSRKIWKCQEMKSSVKDEIKNKIS